MTMKLAEMCKKTEPSEASSKSVQDQKFKLWSYCENKFNIIVSEFDNMEPELNEVIPMVEVLCCIVNKYTVENYSKKLLAEVFFKMEEMYFLNVDLHIMLIKNRIFPIAEWDE